MSKNEELWRSIRFFAHLLVCLILVAALVSSMALATLPRSLKLETMEELPFLPGAYEINEEITYAYVERSLEQYQENQSDSLHHVLIIPGETTKVHYFDFGQEKIYRTTLTFGSPILTKWKLIVGSFPANEGRIEDGNLVLSRKFYISESTAGRFCLVVFVTILIYLLAIGRGLNRFLLDPLERGFRKKHAV